MNRKIRNNFIKMSIACLLWACGGGGGSDGGPSPPPPPPTGTDTLEFTFDGFTEVVGRNSFEVIVQQGDRYTIQVTVNEGLGDLVQVDQQGVRLRIGFDETFTGDIRSTITRAVVTMPELTKIEAINSADVVVAGFTTGYLEAVLDGSARIEAGNCRFDFVDAILNGSSRLTLRDVSPIPAANVTLGGNGSATLNMMSGGTITGLASGSSSLDYYGSNLSVQVTTSGTASVTRLGDTQS